MQILDQNSGQRFQLAAVVLAEPQSISHFDQSAEYYNFSEL